MKIEISVKDIAVLTDEDIEQVSGGVGSMGACTSQCPPGCYTDSGCTYTQYCQTFTSAQCC